MNRLFNTKTVFTGLGNEAEAADDYRIKFKKYQLVHQTHLGYRFDRFLLGNEFRQKISSGY